MLVYINFVLGGGIFKAWLRDKFFLCSFVTFLLFADTLCNDANTEMLRQTSTQRGMQRRGHLGEKDSGISHGVESKTKLTPRHEYRKCHLAAIFP